MKIGRLFIGLKKCSDPGEYVIADWSLLNGYWRWAIFLRKPNAHIRSFKFPWFGPSYDSGKIYWASKGSFGAWLKIPYVCGLGINTQPKWKYN